MKDQPLSLTVASFSSLVVNGVAPAFQKVGQRIDSVESKLVTRCETLEARIAVLELRLAEKEQAS